MLNNTSYYDTSPETFDELIHLAVDRMNERFNDDNHIVYLAWQGSYSDKVSCSHYAPKGKHTNWADRDKGPTHFPGWKGRVWLSYKYEPKSFCSNYLGNTGISSGTGGYGLYDLPEWINILDRYHGHYPCSYASRIFKIDFPLIGSEYIDDEKKQAVAAVLKKNKRHKYIYPVEQSCYVHPNYAK